MSFLFDGIHAHDVSQVLDEDARLRAARAITARSR